MEKAEKAGKMQLYQVKIGEETRQYQEGTSYGQIAEEFQKDYKDDIVLVFVDGKLQELTKTVEKDCTLKFETTASEAGHDTYRRSMSLMLVKCGFTTPSAMDITARWKEELK